MGFLLLLPIVSLALEGDEYPWPEEYTILCSSEEGTGFNWVNGNWKPVKFKNVQRLILKSKKNQCSGYSKRDYHVEEYDVHSKSVCLNERKIGDEYIPILSSYCEEHYNGPKSGAGPRTSEAWIYCNNPKMYLLPNGWYHYAHVHGQLEDAPKDDLKDSQYLEVGKCSMIKP